MKFSTWYYKNLKPDNINRAMFLKIREVFSESKNVKDLDPSYLMTEDELVNSGFYKKYPHLEP